MSEDVPNPPARLLGRLEELLADVRVQKRATPHEPTRLLYVRAIRHLTQARNHLRRTL